MKLFNWNAQKNRILIEEHGQSFEKVVFHIQNGGLLDDIRHPNNRDYPNQRILIVANEKLRFKMYLYGRYDTSSL